MDRPLSFCIEGVFRIMVFSSYKGMRFPLFCKLKQHRAISKASSRQILLIQACNFISKKGTSNNPGHTCPGRWGDVARTVAQKCKLSQGFREGPAWALTGTAGYGMSML